MGTETLYYNSLLLHLLFGDIVPGMGTETFLSHYFLFHDYILFGDIVPGMGTETFRTMYYSNLSFMIWRYSPRNGDGNIGNPTVVMIVVIWRYSPRNGDGNAVT